MVWALGGLGWSDAHDGRDESAARLLGAMLAALARQGGALEGFEGALHERVMAGLRERLGEEELNRLLLEGGELALEDAGVP